MASPRENAGANRYCQLTNLVLNARLVCKASVKDRIILFEKSESNGIGVETGEEPSRFTVYSINDVSLPSNDSSTP